MSLDMITLNIKTMDIQYGQFSPCCSVTFATDGGAKRDHT